ncbi:MAG: aminopeptidase [Bdellovibrionota bacterium]|jgi:predicted aminopeptidase
MRFNNTVLIKSLLFTLLFCNGCNPFYVTRAAYEEIKILNRRESISEIIKKKSLPPDQLAKLELILSAREYAIQIGLKPKDTFTQYAEITNTPLVWIVSASEADSFTPYTWWFPIVGSVPYKGYFSKNDALDLAAKLRSDGYETYIRGADAFSTLGWFNDPVLSSILKGDDAQIVSTVIHEIVHTTLWFPNLVTLNESMAHFIGLKESINFFDIQLLNCKNCSEEKLSHLKQAKKMAETRFSHNLIISEVVMDLYENLNKLYKSSLSKEEKLKQRQDLFSVESNSLRDKMPNLRILNKINNAEIMHLKLYLTNLIGFKRLYDYSDQNIVTFLQKVENLLKKARKSSSAESLEDRFFKELSDLVRTTPLRPDAPDLKICKNAL